MSTGDKYPNDDFADITSETWALVERPLTDISQIGGAALRGHDMARPDFEESPERMVGTRQQQSKAFEKMVHEADMSTTAYIRERGLLTPDEKAFLQDGFNKAPTVPGRVTKLGLAIMGLQRQVQLSKPVEVLLLGAQGLGNAPMYGARRIETIRDYMAQNIPDLPFPELPSPAYAAFLTNDTKEIPAFFTRTTDTGTQQIIPLIGMSLYDCLATGPDILPPQVHASHEVDAIMADLYGYARLYGLARLQYAELEPREDD